MQNLSDIELAQHAQQGDMEAIGALYDRHQLRIYRYVRARIYDTQLAHDLTGDIFLRMVTHIQTYQPTGAPFTAWLYRIAHNYLVNHVQKEHSLKIVPIHQADYLSHTAVNPVAIVEQQMQLETIMAALDQMETLPREVLTLRFLVGLSLQEVAEMLGKSVAAVKSIQHRGLKTMKAFIQ